MTHPQQAAELQGFDSVPGHEQPVHSAEPLQHGGDVRERVEGEPETAELHQIPQLIRQRAQVIPIQRESLQAGREKNTFENTSFWDFCIKLKKNNTLEMLGEKFTRSGNLFQCLQQQQQQQKRTLLTSQPL